jgi:SAM-dependent methyltransferase
MNRTIRQFIRRIRPLVWLYNLLRYLAGLASFARDLVRFAILNRGAEFRFSLCWQAPRLGDNTSGTEFDRHYVYHPAWAARILAETKPAEHVDISSSLYFCSMISAFIPTHFYDYRPADLRLDNLVSDHADILALPFADESIASLSCMHVVEHIGLGRYGDPLDPVGDLRAITELKRVLAPEGNLLFVVPVGRPRIMFNAHRIYSFAMIRSYFENLELIEFSLIPDNRENGGLIRNATPDMADAQEYGCGCFLFRKV